MLKQMKKAISLVLILIICASHFEFAYSFPQVENWKNNPVVVYDNKKQAVLKKNMYLKSPFAVVNANGDQFDFKLNSFERVVVYPKAKVQVLEFADESGAISDFYILDGQIRFKSEFKAIESGAKKNDVHVILKTPFFDLKVNGVVDFLIELNMKEPSVEVKVIDGVLPLEFFAFEKSVTLKSGESVKFQGVLADEGGAIKYDYLLNQRKAPRGQLSEVKSFDGSQFIQEEKELLQKEENLKKDLKLKITEQKRKQKKYEDSFLCKKPFGQRDQCAWWIEAGKCYRKRCNVSGQWGGQVERPVTVLCKNEFYVGVCDY